MSSGQSIISAADLQSRGFVHMGFDRESPGSPLACYAKLLEATPLGVSLYIHGAIIDARLGEYGIATIHFQSYARGLQMGNIDLSSERIQTVEHLDRFLAAVSKYRSPDVLPEAEKQGVRLSYAILQSKGFVRIDPDDSIPFAKHVVESFRRNFSVNGAEASVTISFTRWTRQPLIVDAVGFGDIDKAILFVETEEDLAELLALCGVGP